MSPPADIPATGARPADPQRQRTRRRRRRAAALAVIAAVAGLVAVTLSAGFGRNPRVVPSVHLDRPAPPLAGRILDGGVFDLAAHRGAVVVVNFWASWCTACKREHPHLLAAAHRLAPRPVEFVGVNVQDREQDAQAMLEEMGAFPYPSVVDPDGRIAIDWGLFGVPETFVLDPDGRVRAKAVGAVTEDWVVGTVAALLAEADAGANPPDPLDDGTGGGP